MATFMKSHVYVNSELKRLLNDFNTATKAPEKFISPQVKVASHFTNLTKQIFDFSQRNTADSKANLNSLPELIIDNFDDEQIWQELELQNKQCLGHSFQDVAKVLAKTGKASFFKENKSKTSGTVPQSDDDEDEAEDEDEGQETLEYSGSQDLFPEMQTEEDGDSEHESDDSESETNFDIDAFKSKSTVSNKRKQNVSSKGDRSNMRTSVVDDRFFKLSEMERFLELEDAREERRRQEEEGRGRRDQDQDDEDDDDDDESIDFFQELPSDDEDEDVDESQEFKDAKEMLYSDFYPDPDDGDTQTKAEKSVRFKGIESDEEEDDAAADGHSKEDDDDDESDEEEEEDVEEEKGDINEGLDAAAARKALSELLGEEDSDEGEDALDILGGRSSDKKKSAFEERQDRLKQKIQQLEEANLSSKPWQLSGEVTGGKRPANSLLEEDLDFDATPKPGVEITEETTQSLEDIIRQRILDTAWDDVERKVKPKEDPYEFKKRVTLDQEKSKLSLAEIYEKEYIKQTQGEKEEEEDPAHVEIKTMMNSLFLKLDALSNFHYTPKPAIAEVKIVTNMPSISMEEVAPVTATDATLLAPEEIQEKTQGEFKGDTEKTETDKKHARRKKKVRQRVRAKEKEKREKLVEKLNPGLGNKYSKQAAMEKLKKSSKLTSSRTTIVQEGKGSKKSLTSSKLFFNRLQEEVTREVHGVKAGKKNKQSKQAASSSKLKL